MDQNDGRPQAIYVDGIQIALTEHGAKLMIQSADANIKAGGNSGQIQMDLKISALLNLSHEHLKLFTIYAHRQLREWEKENGDIPLAKKVLESQKIDLKTEW